MRWSFGALWTGAGRAGFAWLRTSTSTPGLRSRAGRQKEPDERDCRALGAYRPGLRGRPSCRRSWASSNIAAVIVGDP